MKNFIIGILTGALAVALWLLKTAKPVINTENYIAKADQSIKKLKNKKHHRLRGKK